MTAVIVTSLLPGTSKYTIIIFFNYVPSDGEAKAPKKLYRYRTHSSTAYFSPNILWLIALDVEYYDAMINVNTTTL